MYGAALVFSNDETHLRFYAAAEIDVIEKLSFSNAKISFSATVVSDDSCEEIVPVTFNSIEDALGTSWRILSADTKALDEKLYNQNYSMQFSAVCTYSDGSVQTSNFNGIYCQRNATQVAKAALADKNIQYDSDIVEHLTKILSVTPT